MALTIPALQYIKDNTIKISASGPSANKKFVGFIKEKGQGGKILIQSFVAFESKKHARETMENIVSMIKDIKTEDLSSGILPVDTLANISMLLRNQKIK